MTPPTLIFDGLDEEGLSCAPDTTNKFGQRDKGTFAQLVFMLLLVEEVLSDAVKDFSLVSIEHYDPLLQSEVIGRLCIHFLHVFHCRHSLAW